MSEPSGAEAAERTEGGARRRGRPRVILLQSQAQNILDALESGLGRVLACRKAGISYPTFLKLIREDADLRGRVIEAERARVESCEVTIYRLAQISYESPVALRAALAYLGRRDRVDAARRARREAAAEKAARKAP